MDAPKGSGMVRFEDIFGVLIVEPTSFQCNVDHPYTIYYSQYVPPKLFRI
jgi:hypothetical protein